MRFGDYAMRHELAVQPVARFAGFAVGIGVPAGWELTRSITGMWVWCDTGEQSTKGFCANAVLTMHCVAAALAEDGVFAMLVDEQLQSVPGCREIRRAVAVAADGIGVQGSLALQIPTHEFGAIDSASQARIIKYGEQTMIAQLTVTAPLSSKVTPAAFWLTVRPGSAPAGIRVETSEANVAGARRPGDAK